MKKKTHPKTLKTQIVLNDGSSFKINWIYLKNSLKLESDFINNPLWNKKKK